ncbi:phosphotransferase family protein [Micromonospora sp. CPCC 206061]|uniref:phosphotransferase family protein n=1 Tax=Micromonospora sp. CPCC 206061 TaxID=3122410 RepID=UPI002FF1186F
MESLTKRQITEDELVALVRRGFGPTAAIDEWRELTDGTYNAAYALTVDERPLVLKVAPPPGLDLLTHEVDLMRTEAEFYRRASAAGIPVPEVVFADFDRALLSSDYAFLSLVPGTDLNTSKDGLTAAQVAVARAEIAALTARLHTITGPGYGYPLRESRSWRPTWRAAFGAMVDDLLADASRLNKPLPTSPERIGELLRRHADVLDDVDRPALVHFDLWDGNVFIDTDGRVTGLIDGERAFFGDPVAEFVSLALFRDLSDAPELLAGYAEGSGAPFALTSSVRRRLNLYTTYLYVIMAIEGATRGWQGPERDRYEAWLGERLEAQLALL